MKVKVSATVNPERLDEAKRLTGSDNVSEVLDRGLAALIKTEQERVHAEGYAHVPQAEETIGTVDPSVWYDLPWEDE